MMVRTYKNYRLTEGNRRSVIYALAMDGEPLDWIDPTEEDRRLYESVKKAVVIAEENGWIIDLPFEV